MPAVPTQSENVCTINRSTTGSLLLKRKFHYLEAPLAVYKSHGVLFTVDALGIFKLDQLTFHQVP